MANIEDTKINIFGSQKQQSNLTSEEIKVKNKNVIACWFLMITQLFYCFMYGFFFRINEVSISKSQTFVSIALLFVLIVAGFGLTLIRSFRMAWSSLGFNLLITALSAQTFFLVNAFWTKAFIYSQGEATSFFNSQISKIYLSPNQISTQTHATLIQAIKCSLACIVAFSYIIGRAGILQLYFVTILGTIIYQLARHTCLNNFPYEIGSIKIFLYGGVFGMMVSLMLARLGNEQNIVQHYNQWKNRNNIILIFVGILIIWALFPLLASQISTSQNSATSDSRVFTVVLAMSSAGLLSIFVGASIYGFQMVIYSILGAGVAILSSTAYISNPVYAILFGLVSTIFQYLFLKINEKLTKKVGPLDPHAFVFIGQGFLGIFYQVINRQIVYANPNSLVFNWLIPKKSEYILGNGAITIGYALILGFLLGTAFACCSNHEEDQHFIDWTYWRKQDENQNQNQNQKQKQKQIYKQEVAMPNFQAYVNKRYEQYKQKNTYL